MKNWLLYDACPLCQGELVEAPDQSEAEARADGTVDKRCLGCDRTITCKMEEAGYDGVSPENLKDVREHLARLKEMGLYVPKLSRIKELRDIEIKYMAMSEVAAALIDGRNFDDNGWVKIPVDRFVALFSESRTLMEQNKDLRDELGLLKEEKMRTESASLVKMENLQCRLGDRLRALEVRSRLAEGRLKELGHECDENGEWN